MGPIRGEKAWRIWYKILISTWLNTLNSFENALLLNYWIVELLLDEKEKWRVVCYDMGKKKY